MSPDAARIAEARSWLVKAASDLRTAIHEFTATPPLLNDIAFHTQQAVEKTRSTVSSRGSPTSISLEIEAGLAIAISKSSALLLGHGRPAPTSRRLIAVHLWFATLAAIHRG